VLEVAQGEAEGMVSRVKELMIGAAELAVPLKVDVGIGRHWDEAH
jgi:DNA polymerase I